MRPIKAAIGNIFGREDAIEADRCLSCGVQYTREKISMWPMDTQKEYQRSGVCRKCQIIVFEIDQTVCTCDNPCCAVDVGVGIITCNGMHCPVHGEE